MIKMRPSNAHHWANCAGWFKFMQTAPLLVQDNAAADEGTEAHAFAAQYLELGPGSPPPPGTPDEMAEAVEFYLQAIEAAVGPVYTANIEQSCYIMEDMQGTPDYFRRVGDTLHIFDFKYGRKYVEVIENPQLLLYTLGVINEIEKRGGQSFKPIKYVFHIVQPRGFHPDGGYRTWEATPTDVAKALRKLETAYAAAKDGGDLTAGEHCLYCDARHTCPSLAKGIETAMDFAHAASSADPEPGEIGRELAALQLFEKMLKARISGVEAQATAMAKAGAHIPGWMLESKQGRLTWNAEYVGELPALGEALGLALTTMECVTPTQAINLGVTAAMVNQMADRKMGAPKLTRTTETTYIRMFKNV